MNIYESVMDLHLRTLLPDMNTGRLGIARRIYMNRWTMNAVQNINNANIIKDLTPMNMFCTYIVRNIWVNFQYNRGYFLLDEDYEKELEFTKGLWNIYTYSLLEDYYSEYNVPKSFRDYHKIVSNEVDYLRFSLYDAIKGAVLHNELIGSPDLTSVVQFDRDCLFPSGNRGYLTTFVGKRKIDNRQEPPMRLVPASIMMYKYAALGYTEPYPTYWVENAQVAFNKAICLLSKKIEVKFNYAYMYELDPREFVKKLKFKWYNYI